MRSYARNQGSQATAGTILADIRNNGDEQMSDGTVYSYIKALKEIFVIEDSVAWNPNLRTSMESLNSQMNMSRINSMRDINSRSAMGKSQRPINIQISEGAVQLDARNMTTKESRQIMINALEGLDIINGIDVRSV